MNQIVGNIKTARHVNKKEVHIKFGAMDMVAMHPQSSVPIISHDQLNIISEHLASIKLNIEERNLKHQKYLQHILLTVNAIKFSKKRRHLIRKKFKQQDNCLD